MAATQRVSSEGGAAWVGSRAGARPGGGIVPPPPARTAKPGVGNRGGGGPCGPPSGRALALQGPDGAQPGATLIIQKCEDSRVNLLAFRWLGGAVGPGEDLRRAAAMVAHPLGARQRGEPLRAAIADGAGRAQA